MILEAGALGPADVYPSMLRASGSLFFRAPFLIYLREGHLWYCSSILRHFRVSGTAI